MRRALQTAIWSRQAQWLLEQSRARFGDMFTLQIAYEGDLGDASPTRSWSSRSSPATRSVFHAGEGNQILRPILGENSVLVLDEKPHISQRKLLLPPFHGERMQGYGEKMTEIAAREIESWPTGTPYKLRPRMQAITLEIILETVFGVHGGERMGQLRDGAARLPRPDHQPAAAAAGAADRPRPDQPHPRLPPPRRAGRRADRTARSPSAAPPRTSSERDDVLSMLVAARHEDGSPMSDAEIRDELLTLLVAGHETTATALSWAMERLVRHPEKLERLRAEVEAGEDAYLTATIQETLRLRPVIVIVDPQADRAGRARRLRAAGRRLGRPLHPPDPPRPARSTPNRTLPARALPRQPARHLHLDPLRRRRPPLPRRRLRPVRDGGRPPRAGPPPRDRARPTPSLRAPLPPRDHRDPTPRRRGRPELTADGPICPRRGVFSARRRIDGWDG